MTRCKPRNRLAGSLVLVVLLALHLPACSGGSGAGPADVPAPEASAAEVPAGDVAAADVPAAEVPAADVPAADVPAADAPAADAPAADVPAAEVPAADVPAADLPLADIPAADVLPADADIPPGDASTLLPGTGFLRGARSVRIGDTRAQVIAALGAPGSVRDLGAPGVLLSFPSGHVSCLASGAGDDAPVQAIYLTAGFDDRTAGDVGSGSSRDAVRAEFGEPVEDPFLGTWRYSRSGIAFDWDQDRVVAVTVQPPVL